jgi:hypothetical protein
MNPAAFLESIKFLKQPDLKRYCGKIINFLNDVPDTEQYNNS